MKTPTKEVRMGVVQLGYNKYVLPLDKAYQLHSLLGEAVQQSYEYVANRTFNYLHTTDEVLSVGHEDSTIDLLILSSKQRAEYWNHQKARAVLIPNDQFACQTLAEYEEHENDKDV